MIRDPRLRAIAAEAEEATSLTPYRGVNALWVCLVKLANLLPSAGEEHEQVASLLRNLSRDEAVGIVSGEGVDRLLNLEPPLETILGDERERLSPLPAGTEVARIRSRRAHDPKAALAALFEILQRIRDKREHGFKTADGPRDSEILGAAFAVLNEIVLVLMNSMQAGSLELFVGRHHPQES